MRHATILGALGTVIMLVPTLTQGEVQRMSMIATTEQKQMGPRDDSVVATKLEEKLRMDQRINWQALEVVVEDGQVYLHGIVKRAEEKGLATRIVTSEPGIKAVANHILIDDQAPDTDKKADLQDKDGIRMLEGEGGIKDQEILP